MWATPTVTFRRVLRRFPVDEAEDVALATGENTPYMDR